MENSINKDEELTKLIGFVDEYIDATQDSRDLSQKCRDYHDGYQWTADEREALRARKQPCITNNRIKPKVQFLRGMEMQTRTDPKAFPRNPNDEESAEVSTDMLRYIAENNTSDQKFSKGFKSFLVEGTQAHEVIVEDVRGKLEIRHNVIEWDRLWYDPHSREEDFSDVRYLGTLQWMDQAEGKEDFPDAPKEVWAIDDSGGTDDDTHEDRPAFYTDKKRKRVRVFFAYYIKRGEWHFAIFTKNGFIKDPAKSPYLDDDGRPEPQFVFQSAFVDIDGGRYGEVASYLDLQDEVNKRRSKLLHLMSVRQTFATKGATGGKAADIKAELAKPDGHAEFVAGDFGRDFGILPTADMASGQSLLLQEAKQEIDAQGANAALAGTDPRSLSGRAVQSLQQGGSVEIGPLFDGNKHCKNRVYRMMFNRAKQFWTEERWVRVTDSEEKLKFTGINKQITLEDQIIEQLGEVPPQFQGDPRLKMVVGVQNPVNELDVDIIISEAPNTVTLQQEQFEILSTLYQANPNAVPFELLIKASQLRNKDELLKLIQGGDEEQQAALAQAQAQEQQEQNEIIKAAAIADIEEKKSSAAENMASAQKDLASAEKLKVETEQIAIQAAMEVEEATAPQVQVFG